jgi:hypothetical protein
MATLAQKIECEQRMRRLLEESGLPEPHAVEYGYTCVRFYFWESKACVIVDIDNPDDNADLLDVELAELEAGGGESGGGAGDDVEDQEDSGALGFLESFGDLLSDETPPS